MGISQQLTTRGLGKLVQIHLLKLWFRRSIAWLSVALAPTVRVLHGETGEGRSILMYQRFGKLENKRVSRIQRNIHLAAQREVPLRIVLVDAIDDGGAPKRIERINGSPRIGREQIANVSFPPGSGSCRRISFPWYEVLSVKKYTCA